MKMNTFYASLTLLLAYGQTVIADEVEEYDFSYKSDYSVTHYETDLALLPQFDVTADTGEVLFDRRDGLAAKVSVNQSIESVKQTAVAYSASKTMTWQANYLPQPNTSKLNKLYTFSVKNERIPVYYDGQKHVLNRVVLQDENGQVYFTAKYGTTANAKLHFPASKLQYKLTSLNGSMQSDGKLSYKKSNPFTAAKTGYKVRVSLNNKVNESFVIAPSLRLNGSHSANLSTPNAKNGNHGSDGRGGTSYSSSALSSVAGAFAGGSGRDGNNGGDGRRGGDGGDGYDAKDVGSINVTIKPFNSPFYQQPLKDYTYKSRQGSDHLLFEQTQKLYIAAVGGRGGKGGNGGDGGNGGNGESGSAGTKGNNASEYSSAGSGGTGRR